MIPNEDNIGKTSVIVFLIVRAHVHAYVAAVLTSASENHPLRISYTVQKVKNSTSGKCCLLAFI